MWKTSLAGPTMAMIALKCHDIEVCCVLDLVGDFSGSLQFAGAFVGDYAPSKYSFSDR
jgi:hypothetical protein